MNLLKEFKVVLSSVSEELKTNLKPKIKSDYKDLTVYLGPGAVKLLEKKNITWSEIRDENMVIVQKVKTVDASLEVLLNIHNHNLGQISLLENEMNNISSLNNQVLQLNNMCCSLKDSLIALQDDLAEFENQIAYDKYVKFRNNLEDTVVVHESECNLKVELLKKQLSAKKSDNLASKEKHIQRQLSERQKVFEQEYQNDLREYLQKGRLERHVSDPVQLLEDTEINTEPIDEEKLNEFLN